MGKIRVNTIGDETAEAKQKEKAQKRKEAKQVEKKASEKDTDITSKETKQSSQTKEVKSKKTYKKVTARVFSKKYQEVKALVEKNKLYKLIDALELLPKIKMASFDETVELHINTMEPGLSGMMTLPHGTGKQIIVAILAPAVHPEEAEKLLKEIEAGKITFDVLIATPDAMPKLAKVARILGPKGLMPNPKAGTVTAKPEEAAKKYAGGQIGFKTEAKLPVLHLSVGKVSFGKDKLIENINAALDAVQMKNIKNITLKSTMSPAIKLEVIK